MPVSGLTNQAKATDLASKDTTQTIVLDQAALDQILAPIALYPDTLLSHILVASTYPIEVVQAARWRATNEDLNEQQVLDAVEDKDWDPSVKALTPFNDLLQKLSEDLDWLQNLGSAFLANEQQLLSSVQNLRQKAYQAGNLTNNQYVQVAQQDNQIVIETVREEVIYVPYYDTRIVYGNWWWDHHQPLVWHRPRHSYYYSGIYWSHGFSIFPSFYFGGFHWRNRHVVANYHYQTQANRNWSNNHTKQKRVRVTEYPRWSHNSQRRKGAQYKVNGQTLVVNNHRSINTTKHQQQFDKKRVVNVRKYKQEAQSNASQIKQKLKVESNYHTQSKQETKRVHQGVSDKKRHIQQNKQKVVRDYAVREHAEGSTNKHRTTQQKFDTIPDTQNQVLKNRTVNQNREFKVVRKINSEHTKSQTNNYKNNKRREIKVERRSQSHNKQK